MVAPMPTMMPPGMTDPSGVPPGPAPAPGPPPGMSPMGMPPQGPPPMPGPMPQPQPQPTDLLPDDPAGRVVAMLQSLVETQGEDAARERLLSLPPAVVDALWQLAGTNDELAGLLDQLLPSEPTGPDYPGWFVPPPKPDKAMMLELTSADEEFWRPFREATYVNLAYYHAPATGEAFAVYNNFNKDRELPFISSALTDEVNLLMAILGGADVSYQVPFLDPNLENATQQAEDALYAWDEEEQARYVAAGNNPFRRDEVFYLLIPGMIAWRTGLKLDDAEYPFDDALLDPTTVYPFWDRHGLCRVTRCYRDTVANVIADYDVDGKVAGVFKKKLKNKGLGVNEQPRFYRWSDTVKVTTYHDRWWYACYADDEELIPPTAHRFGFVPYVIAKSGLGDPMSSVRLDSNGGTAVWTPYSGDEARISAKFISHFHYRKRPHAQKEMVATKLFNIWSKVDRPAWMVYQDEVAEASGTPTIKNEENAVTTLKMRHEEASPLIEVVNPNVFGPLMSIVASDDQTGRMPLAGYGVSESANQSGNATEGLVESGRDKLTVHFQTLEAFDAARASMKLKLWRDWGHLIQGQTGEYGVLQVPYQNRRRALKQGQGGKLGFELTPETIKRTGTRVKATRTHLRMQNLAPLGNAAAMWMQINGMSAREAMEMRGVRDPDAVFMEREYEQALLDPALQQVRRLQILRERDPEAAAMYEQLIQQKQQSAMAGSGGPPSFGPGGGGPMGPNTSAMNLPALGMGQQGPTGRPPGGGAPPSDFRPTPGPPGLG